MEPTPLENSVAIEIDAQDFHAPQEIREHPRFDEAARLMIEGLLNLYAYDRRLRMLIDFDHIVTFQLIVCLAAAQRDDVPESWLTMNQLQFVLPQAGVEPGRPIGDWVTSLTKDGYLESRRAPSDARVKIYQPTEYMLGLDREWLELIHSPLALLYPHEDFTGAMSCDPQYQNAYRLASLQTVGVVSRIMRANPGADFFIRQSAGTRILMTLMMETRAAPGEPTKPGFMTRAAEASGVSRTHVRNILREAEKLDLVRIGSSRNDGVSALPQLHKDVDNWIADSLAGTSITHGVALRLL